MLMNLPTQMANAVDCMMRCTIVKQMISFLIALSLKALMFTQLYEDLYVERGVSGGIIMIKSMHGSSR